MREIKNITVKTLPNGYSLEFDGMKQNGYMYHTTENLLKGFMVHIGMDMTDQLNMENVDDFIVAAMTWNDNEKNVNEITRLTDLCKKQESSINSRQKEILRMTNKLATVLELVKNAIKEEDVNEKKKILQNAIRAIGKVNALTEKDKELLNTPDEEDEDEDEDE